MTSWLSWRSGIRSLSLGLLYLALAGIAAQAPAPAKTAEKAKTPPAPAAAPGGKPTAENTKAPAEVKEPAKTEAKPKAAPPELLARIRDALKFGNSQQVRDALNTLGRLTADEQKTLLPELKQTCKSQDGLVLRKMAEFIGNAPFNDLDDQLAQFLTDKTHEQLFFATVGAIAKKKPSSALPVLTKEIREQDFSKPGNRIPDAVHLLTIYKDNSLQAFLVEKLQAADTYADYRSGILKYLGEATPWSPQLKDRVLKLFQDEAEPLTVRGSSAYALGKAQITEAKPVLKDALTKIENMKSVDEKKRYTRFRMQVIASLILLKDDDVREILYAMARDDDEQVRLRAVHQIGQLKIEDARQLLTYKSKFDPSARVQKEAKKALSLLDGQKVVPEDPGKEQ
ncbi:MAG: HEAT repeat domain-containing protein [Spirochaetota bacterium]